MEKLLHYVLCLTTFQVIQLVIGAFLVGTVFTIAILTRRSALQLLEKIECLKKQLRGTQAAMAELENRIKFHHPDEDYFGTGHKHIDS